MATLHTMVCEPSAPRAASGCRAAFPLTRAMVRWWYSRALHNKHSVVQRCVCWLASLQG